MSDTSQTSPPVLSVYRRLIHDPSISHGAFRLWHFLRDKADEKGQSFYGQRRIAADLHCKTHSLAGWTSELINAGYLAVETKGQNHQMLYTVLSSPGVVMAKQATRGDAEKGDAKQPQLPKGQHAAMPVSQVVMAKQATRGDAEKGDISNNSEVITTKGKELPPLVRGSTRWISFEKELTRWREDFEKLNQPEQYERGTKRYAEYYEFKAKIEARQKMMEAVE